MKTRSLKFRYSYKKAQCSLPDTTFVDLEMFYNEISLSIKDFDICTFLKAPVKIRLDPGSSFTLKTGGRYDKTDRSEIRHIHGSLVLLYPTFKLLFER